MSRKKKNTPEIEVEEIVEATEVEEVVEETPVVEDAVEEVVEAVEVEAVVEEVPQADIDAIVAQPANKADYTHDAWWDEVGNRLFKRGYSQRTIVNKAKLAFGAEFDEARFTAYCADNGISGNGSRGIPTRVEAVWKSQK